MGDIRIANPVYRVVLHILFGTGILVLGIGICLDVYWARHEPIRIFYILNVLPGLFFLAVWFVGRNIYKLKWLLICLGVPIGLILSGFVVLCNLGASIWIGGTTPHTDPAAYAQILQYYSYPDSEWTKHFPPKIPDNATNVRFYHLPRFLQRGTIIQLRYVLAKKEIEPLLADCLTKAKQVEESEGVFLGARGDNDLLIPVLRAGEKECIEWPRGYKIMTFDGPSGRYGYFYGVAINPQTNEVVFWADEYF